MGAAASKVSGITNGAGLADNKPSFTEGSNSHSPNFKTIDLTEDSKDESIANDYPANASPHEANDKDQRPVVEVPNKEPSSFEEFRTQSLDVFQKAVTRTQSFKSILNEKGKIQEEVLQLIVLLCKIRKIPGNINAQIKDIAIYRREIGDIAAAHNITNTICDVFNHEYSRWMNSSDNETDEQAFNCLKECVYALRKYTNVSDDFCYAVCIAPGFLKMMKTLLTNLRNSYFDVTHKKKILHYIISTVLAIIYNIVRRDGCVTCVRNIGFTEVVTPYLKSERVDDKLCSLAIIAAVIEDSDIAVIQTNQDTVHLLVDVLRRALDSKTRKECGENNGFAWTCTELALVIRGLAGNDANKKILMEAGCLQWLVKLGKTAMDDTETIESVGAIWALAFDQEIRRSILSNKELGVVDFLSDLMKSSSPKIKQMCAGALWTLCEKHTSSKTNDALGDADKANSDDGHIMISYQWSDQETVIKIRDCLQNAGFKVWIDINEMKGSIPSAMAGAVENATIFLMCMSQKYQSSPNCHLEADYACQLKKTIMPLKMETGYQPRSWAGLICGSKKYYEFSGKYKINSKMEELVRDIAETLTELSKEPQNNVGEKHHTLRTVPDESTYSVPVAMATPNSYSYHVSKVTIDSIRGWTQTDVQKWIEEKNLQSCGINKRTGKELAMLLIMRTECPEFFYRCLETMWKIKDSLNLANIIWALTDLTQELEQKKNE